MFESDGEVHEDPMPGFTVSAIKDIYFMPCDYEETYATEHIMQFNINLTTNRFEGLNVTEGWKSHTRLNATDNYMMHLNY